MVKPLARLTPATQDVLEAFLSSTDPIWGLRLVQMCDRPAGSIYPILARLEDMGWVTSAWEETEEPGPRRRLYEMTAEGARAASARLASAANAVKPLMPAPGRVGVTGESA